MLHEERKQLSEKTLNMKRAIDSLRDELEAIDWYIQRADVCTDKNLKEVLLHNADEEKEHAAMLLEWIRQQDKKLSKELKKYLFSNSKNIAKMDKDKG